VAENGKADSDAGHREVERRPSPSWLVASVVTIRSVPTVQSLGPSKETVIGARRPGATGAPLHPSETMWKEGSCGCPSKSVTDVVLRSMFPSFLMWNVWSSGPGRRLA